MEQALRLLGMAHSADYGVWRRFMQQQVRVRPWLSLGFPPAELVEFSVLQDADSGPRYRLTTTNFGLYSTLGPLPTFYTEELLEEFRQDESVSRDFLDIINNHLHLCFFHARLHNKLFRRTTELRAPQTVHMLHCLMGQAYPSLRAEGPPQLATLELLLRRSRSAMGLETYLAHVLRLAPVRVEQCVPRLAGIPEGQRCRLGEANATLGDNAVLGSHIIDRTGKFRIHFDNVAEADIARFLPDSPEYTAIQTHVNRFLDVPLEFDVVLHPAPLSASRRRGLGAGMRVGSFLSAVDTPAAVTVYHSASCERFHERTIY